MGSAEPPQTTEFAPGMPNMNTETKSLFIGISVLVPSVLMNENADLATGAGEGLLPPVSTASSRSRGFLESLQIQCSHS